jgi:L-amino acid N-acyltransferase YncA
MVKAGGFRVRDSEEGDLAAIGRIYGHWVEHGSASFELVAPAADEIRRRRAAILAGGYPYIVAAGEDCSVLGFAYAGPYRSRPAYRFACEDSVYVAPQASGRGIGRGLLQTLIARCESSGLRLMVAIIGDSGNAPSIGLHETLGFTRAGVLPAIGWKHARWVDTVLMVRTLGSGASVPPAEHTDRSAS